MRAEDIDATGRRPYDHGRLFGFESAKIGTRRRCPYLIGHAEAIRGWYDGWDDYFNGQPEWRQKELRCSL